MKLEISKEELRNFLLHATDEQLAEMIEFIHPVDVNFRVLLTRWTIFLKKQAL